MIPPDQEKVILEHERYVANVLKIREGDRKRWWQSPLLTSGIVAVTTVALTSLLGYFAQTAAKSRELDLQAHESEQRLRRETLQALIGQAGDMMRANMDRLAIARGRYGHLDTAHIAAIARGTNDVDRRWRQEQVTDEFLLALFFGDGSRAPEPWEPTRRAIERYTVCASAAVRTYGWHGAPDTTCALLRSASEDSIAALRRTLIQKYREFAVARH